MSASRLSKELGVSQESLSRWLREARSVADMTKLSKSAKGKPRQSKWTGAEKLRIVRASYGLAETELGALLRREGVHEAQLAEWLQSTEEALSPKAPASRGLSPEARRNRELERELRRKDKALAETAALLVLKKKVQSIWGDEDDIMDPRSER